MPDIDRIYEPLSRIPSNGLHLYEDDGGVGQDGPVAVQVVDVLFIVDGVLQTANPGEGCTWAIGMGVRQEDVSGGCEHLQM